jgi:hypothetical protein
MLERREHLYNAARDRVLHIKGTVDGCQRRQREIVAEEGATWLERRTARTQAKTDTKKSQKGTGGDARTNDLVSSL